MIFDADTKEKREKVAKFLRSNIVAPYVHVEISTLWEVNRASALVKVSLNRKEEWTNGILHNSKYFMVRIDRNGEMEQFAKSYQIPKKLRKTRAKDMPEAVKKITAYINQVK